MTSGEAKDAIAWLSNHNRYVREHNQGLSALGGQTLNSEWFVHQFQRYWQAALGEGRFGPQLVPFLMHYANAETRLQQSRAAPTREDAREPAVHPLHILSEDRELLRRVSKISREVFDEPLSLDDYSAAYRLRVGRPSSQAPRRDEADTKYRDELLAFPELHYQGDGMRSFFGLLLPLITARYQVVLVDEPEAFLHPPQAAELGRLLGMLAQENKLQLIVATHDRHLLTGILESEATLAIVRIDRKDNQLNATQIDSKELETIWSEPALRYSNALDGLFHRLVVLVEAERDAQFYAATLDAAYKDGAVDLPPSEVLFVPCGGKGGMVKFASTLRKLGVPVAAMPDLDILRNKSEVRKLVEALAGTWDHYESGYERAIATVNRPTNSIHGNTIQLLIKDHINDPLPEEVRKAIVNALRPADTSWDQIKAGGLYSLGQGGTRAAAVELADALELIGLVIVRKGELESFADNLSVSKGSGWLPAALEAKVHKSEAARDQIIRLTKVFADRRPQHPIALGESVSAGGRPK